MPRYPRQSETAQAIRASVFARLAERMRRPGLIPLHIGDTHLAPPDTARWEERGLAGEEIYRYGDPPGHYPLREAVARMLGEPIEAILVHAGATHALQSTCRSILSPGDEVLVPSPYWPLIVGVIRSAGGVPVEVPLYERLYEEPGLDPAEILSAAVTPRTAAVYVCSPNNPDGKVLSARQTASLAELSRVHGLWVLSDEVYRDYLYVEQPHISIATLPGMRERTVVVLSFSKSHALAGDRVGVLVGPKELIPTIRKVSNHSLFNVPLACQIGALAALEAGDSWVEAARERYRGARDMVLDRLRLPMHAPEGAAYVFPRVGDDAYPLLERALECGVALAPGDGFGEAYRGYMRLCFTSVPEAQLGEALERLAQIV